MTEVLARSTWIIDAFHQQLARASKRIYDAYFEAFDTELSTEDEPT